MSNCGKLSQFSVRNGQSEHKHSRIRHAANYGQRFKQSKVTLGILIIPGRGAERFGGRGSVLDFLTHVFSLGSHFKLINRLVSQNQIA